MRSRERPTDRWDNEGPENATKGSTAWGEARPNSLRPRGAARAAPTREVPERSVCKRIGVLGLLFVALAVSSVAHAATPEDRAAAREHLTQAQDLKKQGQLAEAIPHFAESQRLDPKLSTALDLADCAELAGKLVEAQAYWAAARDQAKREEKPQSRARAEQRLAAVEKRVAHLSLQLAANAPAGTQVLRDDIPLDQASLGNAQALNPGDHVVVVKATGHDDATYPVKLTEGDNQTLAIAAGPAIAVAAHGWS